MSFLTTWHETALPKEIVDILEKDLQEYDDNVKQSELMYNKFKVNDKIRNSKNSWVPTWHWSAGFIWHYIQKSNRENFLYDLTCFDGENLQYTQYGEGQFYNWHIDAGIDTCYKPESIPLSGVNNSQDFINLQSEYVRKLSFSLQLSSPEDYTGGEVQFMDNQRNTYFSPKKRGTLIIFDSRTPHRVKKIKSGVRKSLVGWIIGPRWK
jgi:PKHD-type hydroxylase